MSKPFDSRYIALAARPWLSRTAGECAFPVEGVGLGVIACCNPCGRAVYCAPHAAAMRGPPTSSAAQFELEVVRWLDRPR
jgi:hypothetical protein